MGVVVPVVLAPGMVAARVGVATGVTAVAEVEEMRLGLVVAMDAA